MIREVEKSNGWDEITYYFESMNDFIKYMIDNAETSHILPRNKWVSKAGMQSRFNDTNDWEDFIDKLKNGHEDYNVDKDVFKTDKYEQSFQNDKDWYGTTNVPKTIMGLPKPSNRLKKTKDIKYYPIFVGFSENAFVDSRKIKKYKLAIFEKIAQLITERQIVDISIFCKGEMRWNNCYVNLIIDIKKHNQNPDMNKLMYFMCGSDILRRGFFRILELDPLIFNGSQTHGYGTPMLSRNDYIEKKFNAILLHSLNSYGGVSDALEDVERRLIQGGI